nr:uncharacterized protein LOC116424624 isoform X2 [Nomia melanderi]
MEEVRHAWASLKSVRKLSPSYASSDNSTTVWYDAPAPVIVHCREFSDEADVENRERIDQGTALPATADGQEISTGPSRDRDDDASRASEQWEVRHRNTVELTAVASVKTDEDGLPTISFSFLHANEKLGTKRSDAETDSSFYDLPRNSHVRDETEVEIETETETETETEIVKVVESRGETEATRDTNEIRATMETEFDGGSAKGPTALDDAVDRSVASEKSEDRNDPAKLSRGSLKSGRKSYGVATDNDESAEYEEYDAGIASMSGSYSDPECSNDVLSTASRRLERSKLQRHRLGKAWSKMKSWLRDETTRINEVVNKHARLQAVGALAATTESGERASYDLTSATTRETGSITRVEEFGLASVAEEAATPDPETGSDARKPRKSWRPRRPRRQRKPAVGSDDPLDDDETLAPVSLAAYRFCSDTENDEADETRDRARKVGPIKRRMLGSIRGLMASTHLLHVHETEEGGQGGFEDVRRYVKQGGDFCKELAAILHERAELEATYAKGLSKLSSKLTKACAKDQGGNSSGGVNEAWRCVGEEMEAAAEAHRVWSITLGEQLAKPIRVGVAEAQGRSRKSIENSVDKAGKSLHEWRNIAAKSKKQSFACARENERLQDLARLQSISQSQQSNNNKSSHHHHHHMTEKEASKLEARRRKAEDSSRRADTEFYTSADRLAASARNCNISHDIETLKNLIRRVESNDACNSEQLLPDFYAEHVTLAMNRERRKQALVRVLHLIRQDLERERRGREGLETLHRAFVATPAFAADESTQNVTEKLHHMRSMLLYLEAARYKVGGTLAEVEGSKRGKHPLAEYILVSRDKQGLQQSVLKVPSWAKNESFEFQDDQHDQHDQHDQREQHEIDVRLAKDHEAESRDWADRTAGDGNSENPPDEDDFSDFDEFSSNSEDNNNQEDVAETTGKPNDTEQCRAIYQYSANLNDELSLSPGDLITVHQKQPDGWWIGECRGRTGIFPATYVQVIH